MAYTRFLLIRLISSLCLIFLTVRGSNQQTPPDLRRFKAEGVAGRFVVNRDALERELRNRKQQDAFCGQDVKLQLPQSLPHSSYCTSDQGEVTLFYETITDYTLAAELSNDLNNTVSTSYQFLGVTIPVVVGTTETHGALCLNLFTNSTKKILHPQFTSIGQETYVDSIVEEDDGTVTLRIDDDEMVFKVQDKVKVNVEKNVGTDFDKLIGKIITTTSYPLPFDWGCEILGSHVSFCQVLDEFRCKLAALGGDVCALTSTSSSERAPTTMTILGMTGIFREMFPYLAETVPSDSLEAERLHREHTTGIKYPCLTP